MSDRPSIPLLRAAVCLDDLVIFDMADISCPKCDSSIGIASVRVTGKEVPSGNPRSVAETEEVDKA